MKNFYNLGKDAEMADQDWTTPGFSRRKYADGEPCGHPGCCNHVTHPCEDCGRIGCKLAQPSVRPDKSQSTER
jgi:hypothetical protein